MAGPPSRRRGPRQEPALQRVVLVALTGYGQAEDKARALAAGFDYHLVKPVDVQVLSELIGRARSSPPIGEEAS
jgi:CheY-like chemotaxis protein